MSIWTDAVSELDAELALFYGVTEGTALKSIVIESTTRTRTTNGEISNTWATFASVDNVLVTFLDMDENDSQAERIQATEDVEFDMTYTAGVSPEMRIVYAGKYYNISGVVVDETGAYRTVATTHRILSPDSSPGVLRAFSNEFSPAFG